MRQGYCSGNLQETSSRRVDGQSSENTMETAFGVSSSGNAAQTVDTPSRLPVRAAKHPFLK